MSVHLEAEKHCHKIKAVRVAWCPMLMQAIQAIQYWKAWLKRALGGVISNNILQKRARLARIKHEAHGATPMQDTIKKRIATAYQTFKRLKGQADQWDTWLGNMIAAQVEDQGCTWSKIWKQVRATKKSRHLAQMVKNTLGTQAHRTGLTQVTAAALGTWPETTYTKKDRSQTGMSGRGQQMLHAGQSDTISTWTIA